MQNGNCARRLSRTEDIVAAVLMQIKIVVKGMRFARGELQICIVYAIS